MRGRTGLRAGARRRTQATDYTEAGAARLLDEQAYTPSLWQLECANVLRTACKRDALGVRLQLPIATQDAALMEAARAAGGRGVED